jgi:hypothetical protein
MKRRNRLMVWPMVAVCATTLAAPAKPTPQNAKASSEEPFRSFRMLDAKLTLLTNQQAALKPAFNPVQSGSGSTTAQPGRRTEAARSMNFTAAEIASIAGRLERLYEGRHQRFGVQTFRLIRIKAQEVQRDLSAVAKAQTGGALDLTMKRLDERIVSLVVHFQAVSGGFGAVRCSPGAWTCCQPKRSKDPLQKEQIACMWGCVPRADRCTGFLGPLIQRP